MGSDLLTIAYAAATFAWNALWQTAAIAFAAELAVRCAGAQPGRHLHRLWAAAALLGFLLPLGTTLLVLRQPPVEQPGVIAIEPVTALPLPPFDAVAAFGRFHLPTSSVWLAAVLVAAGLWRAASVFRSWRHAAAWPDRVTAALPSAWDGLRDRCERALGLADIPIYEAVDLAGPATTGALAPVILLPTGFAATHNEETLTAVLAHEMAHIRRRDYAFHLALELLLLPLAWHPAVWHLRRRLEQARELACDDLVVARLLLDGAGYARGLVAVAAASSAALALGMNDGAILKRRVVRLLSARHPAAIRTWLGLATLASAALAASTQAVELARPAATPPPDRLAGLWVGTDGAVRAQLHLAANQGRITGRVRLTPDGAPGRVMLPPPPPPPPPPRRGNPRPAPGPVAYHLKVLDDTHAVLLITRPQGSPHQSSILLAKTP